MIRHLLLTIQFRFVDSPKRQIAQPVQVTDSLIRRYNPYIYVLCHFTRKFVASDELGCLRIGANVLPICRQRQTSMFTSLAIWELICYLLHSALHSSC